MINDKICSEIQNKIQLVSDLATGYEKFIIENARTTVYQHWTDTNTADIVNSSIVILYSFKSPKSELHLGLHAGRFYVKSVDSCQEIHFPLSRLLKGHHQML